MRVHRSWTHLAYCKGWAAVIGEFVADLIAEFGTKALAWTETAAKARITTVFFTVEYMVPLVNSFYYFKTRNGCLLSMVEIVETLVRPTKA